MNSFELLFILALVAVTTLVSCAAARMARLVPARSTAQAIRALLDWAGMFVLFLAANLVLGVSAILLIRSLTTHFIAFYGLENVILILLSAAQAFVFQMWWKRG